MTFPVHDEDGIHAEVYYFNKTINPGAGI